MAEQQGLSCPGNVWAGSMLVASPKLPGMTEGMRLRAKRLLRQRKATYRTCDSPVRFRHPSSFPPCDPDLARLNAVFGLVTSYRVPTRNPGRWWEHPLPLVWQLRLVLLESPARPRDEPVRSPPVG